MNDSGVRIKYGNFAPEAKENFIPSLAEDELKFDTLGQLNKYDLIFPNFANPCEMYQTLLDGEALAFPSNPESSNIGLWSNQISGDDGCFENPIVLTMTAQGQYSSQLITLTFDDYNNIFANRINIKWYRDEEMLFDVDFKPDSAVYLCRQEVENYDKVVITFYSLNMPKNRLKLVAIDYGFGVWFEAKELSNIKAIQEIDVLSTKIVINAIDFTLNKQTQDKYLFLRKQPLSVYFNGDLKATVFVKNHKRKSKNVWNIQADDYIGLMDGVAYYGGMFYESSAVELLKDIFKISKVPFKIDDAFNDIMVTGYIPYTTCREALMQVAFAIGALVDTSNSDVVNVFVAPSEISQTIGLERIMEGQDFKDEDVVTQVELTSHSYSPINDAIDIYNADKSGEGENVFVKFDQPLHSLSIVNGDIVASGTNYAVINARENCLLTGRKYDHTTLVKVKRNPLVLATESENIISVENATLVSSMNVDNLLESCYNYFVNSRSSGVNIAENRHISGGLRIRYGDGKKYGEFKYGERTPKIITYDKPINVGDVVTMETEYMGEFTGRVIRQSFNLNGNIIIKECEVRTVV